MVDIKKIADAADIIINGYAFTRNGEIIRVINLNEPDRASIIDKNSDIIETTMSDIENAIVMDYYNKNCKFMEV